MQVLQWWRWRCRFVFGVYFSPIELPAVCCGMVGCLVLFFLVKGTPGLPPLNSSLVELWSVVSVPILQMIRACFWDADDLASETTDTPNIRTDGSMADYPVGVFEVAGAGVYLPAPEEAVRGSVWRVAEEYGDARLEGCCAFVPVPSPLQSVQHAEFWCAIIALQSDWPCHLGIDNLNVAGSLGRLLDHGCLAKPLLLVKDGDIVAIAQCMIRARRQDTVRVTKVEGHATEADVQQGRVRDEDGLGGAESDAADLGGRHQPELVMDSRRALLGARNQWYPIMLRLRRFMVAVSRVAVNHDGPGGSAPDPLVWDQGSNRKQREIETRVNSWFLDWALDSGSWWFYFWC